MAQIAVIETGYVGVSLGSTKSNPQSNALLKMSSGQNMLGRGTWRSAGFSHKGVGR